MGQHRCLFVGTLCTLNISPTLFPEPEASDSQSVCLSVVSGLLSDTGVACELRSHTVHARMNRFSLHYRQDYLNSLDEQDEDLGLTE